MSDPFPAITLGQGDLFDQLGSFCSVETRRRLHSLDCEITDLMNQVIIASSEVSILRQRLMRRITAEIKSWAREFNL